MTEVTGAIIAKSGLIAGTTTAIVGFITTSDMTSYLIGMIFAYIYAMNHEEFRVSIKEDLSVIAIGLTLVYFISGIMPKVLGSFDILKGLEIIPELSNIIGVIIGTVILLIVKYWLTIRSAVVKDKLDYVTSNDRLKSGKKEESYEDDEFPKYEERGDRYE